MKSNSLVFFKIMLLILCSNGLRAQNELRIFVSSKDSIRIAHAKVFLNGEELPYESARLAYIKKGYIYKKRDSLEFKITHNSFLTRKLIIHGSDILEGKHSYNTTIFLFKKNDHCYISGRDSIAFEYKPKIICIYTNVHDEDEQKELNKLFKKLKIERVSERKIGFVILKKKNGGKFKETNCKELKALRKSKLILGAGPMIGDGFFSVKVYVESKNSNKAKEIMMNLGFEFIRIEPYSSTMCFKFKDVSIGYGLIDIVNKVSRNPEINSIRLDLSGPPKIY